MILSLGLLIVGLVLLIGGADVLVRGVSALARAAGVPPLVIGMTLVAFGTSTPELVINITSAARGQTQLAFGNILGSCAINIGFVLALTAIIRPLVVESTIITREIPMMLLGVAAILVSSEDSLLGLGRGPDAIDRSDGLMLLLFFCVFLYYSVLQAVSRKTTDALVSEVREAEKAEKRGPVWVSVALTTAGIAAVALGGRLAVKGAVDIAHAMGVPEVVIGFTLVSFGTTLPELVTCITAARRGQNDIALGNVVGSNIFNLLCIGGIVGMIRPVEVPAGGQTDLFVVAGLSAILLPIAMRGPRKITRAEGGFLLALYMTYFVYRTLSATGG